jgi:hypothetical protein
MIDWGYVAGFFDGEGSLHRDNKKSTVQIRMDNTCKESIVRIQQFINCGTISNRGRDKPHHKDRYRLTVANHTEVLRIRENMLPYLIVKRRRLRKPSLDQRKKMVAASSPHS